jgi:hypothetical protein
VPGVSDEVQKEITAIAHDQMVLRMCTAVQESSIVVHPLFANDLNSLDLTGFEEYDGACFIQGSVESLTSAGGQFLLRRFRCQAFDPPLRARLIWLDRDQDYIFDLELEAESRRTVISNDYNLHPVFIEWRAHNFGTFWVEHLEQLVKIQKRLDAMVRDLSAIVLEVRGQHQIVTRLEANRLEANEGTLGRHGHCSAALTLGLAIRDMLPVADLIGTVLCYLQFDFEFPHIPHRWY